MKLNEYSYDIKLDSFPEYIDAPLVIIDTTEMKTVTNKNEKR